MYIHNLIKIEYVRQGYLPNYPYHLISDREMIEAFIIDNSEVDSYFTVNYPCMNTDTFGESYATLKAAIMYHLNNYLDYETTIPDWVYSYMLGTVIGPNTPDREKGDLLTLLNLTNEGDITENVCKSCLSVSEEWVRKLPPGRNDHRPPTMFGEPHVIKALRLNNVDISS